MARQILDFDGGSLPVSGTNPYGAIDDGATIVNAKANDDMQVFFQKLMADAGITPNHLPDNTVNGFQLFDAYMGALFLAQTSPSYIAGWLADPTSPIKIRKVGAKSIHIKGRTNLALPNATVSVDTPIFTLPVGSRPLEDQVYMCADISTPTPVYVKIASATGQVLVLGTLQTFNSQGVYLNISFDID